MILRSLYDIDNASEIYKWCVVLDGFFSMNSIDISDVSPLYDTVYEFRFRNEETAMWFDLKWR